MNLPAQRRGRTAMKTETRFARVLGLLLILGVAGCAHTPPRQGLFQPGGGNFNGRTLVDPGLKKFMEQQLSRSLADWPPQTWDETSLTLVAWYFSPRLDEVRGQWERAEVGRGEASGQSKLAVPQTRSFPDGMLSEFSSGFVRQAIARELGGLHAPPVATSDSTSSNRLSRATKPKHPGELLRLQLQTVAWQLRAQVRTNLLAYVAAQRGEALLKELEATYADLVRTEEVRAAPDSTPELQLSLLRLQLAQVRLVLIQTRLAKMDTRERLAHSLSIPVSALFDVEVTYDFSQIAAGIQTVPGLRWRALQSRPDILRALADYRDAEEGLRAEMARRRLNVSFPPACQWDRGRNQWVVNLDLGLPDGRAGKILGKAEARRIAAAARLLSLQSEIIADVERSATVYQMTAGEVGGIDALISVLLRQYDGLAGTEEDQLPPELAGPPELLARLQLLAAFFARMEAQVKLQTALGALEDALQQPLAAPARRHPKSLSLPPKPMRDDEMQPLTHTL